MCLFTLCVICVNYASICENPASTVLLCMKIIAGILSRYVIVKWFWHTAFNLTFCKQYRYGHSWCRIFVRKGKSRSHFHCHLNTSDMIVDLSYFLLAYLGNIGRANVNYCFSPFSQAESQPDSRTAVTTQATPQPRPYEDSIPKQSPRAAVGYHFENGVGGSHDPYFVPTQHQASVQPTVQHTPITNGE